MKCKSFVNMDILFRYKNYIIIIFIFIIISNDIFKSKKTNKRENFQNITWMILGMLKSIYIKSKVEKNKNNCI